MSKKTYIRGAAERLQHPRVFAHAPPQGVILLELLQPSLPEPLQVARPPLPVACPPLPVERLPLPPLRLTGLCLDLALQRRDGVCSQGKRVGLILVVLQPGTVCQMMKVLPELYSC